MHPLLLYMIPCAFIAVGILLSYVSVRVDRRTRSVPRLNPVEAALSPFVPFWAIVDANGLGVAAHTDLTYSCLAELSGIDADCLDDEALDHLGVRLHPILQNLPAGARLQFLHETDGNVRDTIEGYRASGAASPLGTPGRWLVELKANYLSGLSGLRRSRLLLSVSLPGPSRPPLVGPPVNIARKALRADHDERLRKISAVFEQVRSGFEAARVRVRPLGKTELRREIYQRLNPTRKRAIPDPFEAPVTARGRRSYVEPQSAREQVIFSGIRESERDLLLDGQRMRVLTLKTLPDPTNITLIEPLLVALRFHCRVAFAVETLDSQAALDELKQRRDQSHALANFREKRNQEAEAQEQAIVELIEKILESTLRMTRVALTVVLSVDAQRHDARVELDRQEAEVLRTAAAMPGAQMQVDEFCQLPEFLATLPGNAGRSRRWRVCTSENAVDLFPVWQPFVGSKQPLVVLENTRNNLVGLSPFDSLLDNPNAFVAGASGSGKSVWTNVLLFNALAAGAKILIVDRGGSYQRLIEIFSGQYFTVGLDGEAPCRLNLFFDPKDVVREDGTLEQTRHQLMCAVVERMACDALRPELGHAERATISLAIAETYRRAANATPILSDLLTTLRQMTGSEDAAVAHDLAARLRIWTEGPAAKILNGPSTISLTADCAAFDLKGLESQKDLQSIVMLILSGIIWNLVMRDRTEAKMIVFDEVWQLLSSPSSARIIEELYRTARKYRASILTISQSVDDFAGSSIASALMGNSATTYLLRHGRNHEQIGKQFQLNERELYHFQRLEMRRYEFTEILVLHGQQHFVGRVVLSPLEYWMTTSDPSDIALEQAIKEQYPNRSLFARLCVLSEKYPKGAAKAAALSRRKESEFAPTTAPAGG